MKRKALSPRIRIFLNPQLFLSEFTILLRHRIRKYLDSPSTHFRIRCESFFPHTEAVSGREKLSNIFLCPYITVITRKDRVTSFITSRINLQFYKINKLYILDFVQACFFFCELGNVSRDFNRELKQTSTTTATRTPLNKRFNEQNNSCARAL